MGITTLKFFVFLVASVVLYYVFPKKHRWLVLLGASLVFFMSACSWQMLIYLAFGIVATYIGTRLIGENLKTDKSKKIALFITLLCIVGQLVILKYINIIPTTINGIASIFNLNLHFASFNLLAPLGISYYALSLIGYTLDVYRGTSKPQKNILKHALFTCYYPVMISGPIVRYEEMKKELFEPRKYCFKNVLFGAERIVYGLLKKMVIADQLGIVVNAIFSQYSTYSGIYLVIGVIFYAIQIYTDFSGCMDIVIGASKMYGVVLPENFKSPFFSRNLSEFWRRWHITLGLWAKDYIMYPLLISKPFQNLAEKCKKKFGKKIGKKIPTIIAIFILWLIIGIWHGASYKYIFAAGILPWIYLTISELCEPLFKKLTDVLHINTEKFSYRLFESIRTIALMCFIWLFVLAPNFLSGFDLISNIFNMSNLDLRLTLPQIPYTVIFIAGLIVLAVDYLQYKDKDVLELFNKQGIIFRYIVIFFMLYLILIYGAYGPGYNPADFIYGGF